MNEEEKKAIELLEEFIKYYEAEATSRKFRGTLSIRVDEDDIDALENLINMYKRVLKENEELKKRYDGREKRYTKYLQNEEDKHEKNLEILQKENEQLRTEVNSLKAENEELKNNTRKNENELEFDIDCDWIALQKMLDESEKSNEYISYKNEKWIKEKYCIPIQKIKDKIKEIDERIKNPEKISYWDSYTISECIGIRSILQELLEETEK